VPSDTRPEHVKYEERYRAVYAAGVPFAAGDHGHESVALCREFLETRTQRGKLIDFGCGEGFTAAMAAEFGYEVLAIDAAPSAIAKCKQTHTHPHLRFRQADVCELGEIDSDSFDFALDLGCFHMLVDDAVARRYLGHAHRVLRPGGFWYGQNLVPADDAAAWCPHERERVEWWRERISEQSDGAPITDTFEVEGKTVEVTRPHTSAAFRGVREQVSLLTAAGFRVDSARVVTPGVNSPFEAVLVARKPS